MTEYCLLWGGAMADNRVSSHIRRALPRLTKSEAKVARYILQNQQKISLETGASLAQATQLSEITISRFLNKVGYRGMRALKEDLRLGLPEQDVQSHERLHSLMSSSQSALINEESAAILKLAEQVATQEWRDATDLIAQADRIFLTGFQTVKGVSEDFARRLSIVRDAVRFVAVHDGGLVEWTMPSKSIERGSNVLILTDVTPYAREAEMICKIATERGIAIIVFTDEFNNWAYAYTSYVFHVHTKTGSFLETTAPLVSLMNFMVHSVAEKQPDIVKERIENWQDITGHLELF